MVKKSDKSAAKNVAVKLPAAQAGDATREAMADGDGAGGWGQPAGDQSASAATQAKEGDKARVNGVNVVYREALGKWVPDAPPKDEPRGQIESPPQPAGQVGWGLDGQQKIVDEHGADASEAGKVAEAAKPKRVPRKKKAEEEGTNLTGMSRDLVNAVERIERLAEERASIADDIKEIYGELKGKGYSSAILRKVIARRQLDPDKRKEQDDMLDLYEEALR